MQLLLLSYLFSIGLVLTIAQEFTTVIDLICNDVQFSYFVRVLQINGKIPYLNELNNFTLLAPINSAFASIDLELFANQFDLDNYILYDEVILTDNFKDKTKIFINHNGDPIVIRQDSINDIPIWERDLVPNMQNASVQGIAELMLPYKDSVDTIKSINNHSNSGFYNKFNYFIRLIQTISLYEHNNNDNNHKFSLFDHFANMTILVPEDSIFDQFYNEIELNYILNKFNKLNKIRTRLKGIWVNDLSLLLQNYLIHDIWGGSHSEFFLTNLNNDPIKMTSAHSGTEVIINDMDRSILANIPSKNGLLHFFNDLNLTETAINFTAEKYLHGLNCSKFVDEIYYRNLQHFINNNDKDLTIFLPEPSQDEDVGFGKSTLLYHLVEEKVWLNNHSIRNNGNKNKIGKSARNTTKEPTFTRFLNSSFCSSNKKLGGNCQRLKITGDKNNEFIINDNYRIINKDPYQIGNTLIYNINHDLSLPGDIISSVSLSMNTCTKSLYFMRMVNLLNLAPNHQGYTIFLPCSDSWDNLGLNLKYIQNNFTAMDYIMKNLIFNGLYYTDDNTNEKKEMMLTNLNNKNVSMEIYQKVNKKKPFSNNQDITLSLDTFRNNFTIKSSSDILFSHGVIHPIDDSPLPLGLNITIKDLIYTTGNEKFLKFLEHFNRDENFLDGEEPYSILVPTLSSFNHANITFDFNKLDKFLKMHIISGNQTSSLLNCNGDITNKLGEVLHCTSISSDSHYLSLRDGSPNTVRILNKGCTTLNNKEACVFLIDRPILLNWIGKEKYNLNLPLPAIAFGIVLGVVIMLVMLSCILCFRITSSTKQTTYSNSDSNSNVDEDQLEHGPNHNDNDLQHVTPVGYGGISRQDCQRQPLLRETTNNQDHRNYDSINDSNKTSNANMKVNQHNNNNYKNNSIPYTGELASATYSENACSKPIHMSSR